MHVLLVAMPFGAPDRPALGLSQLQAAVRIAGGDCDVAYLNLAFARHLGWDDYWRLLRDVPYTSLACEWVFAEALFGSDRLPRSYVGDILRGQWALDDDLIDTVERARAKVDLFLREALDETDWRRYSVVGFTTVGQQNLASLALAARVKARHPDTTIVFGGHAWEAPMGWELHARFPFVDFAFSGEADWTFPALTQDMVAGRSPVADKLPGVMHRSGGLTRATGDVSPPQSLDSLPTPRFDDYRSARQVYGVPYRVPPVIPFEASRGCWWAGRQPCGFCGLNGAKRSYRSKSEARIEQELRALAATWPTGQIDLVDNVVPEAFLRRVLPRLAAQPLPVPIGFSVRPSVSKQDVEAMGATGASIQCGLESLSPALLAAMTKGADALENVRLLKWCAMYRVKVSWNLLYAIPGESEGDYRAVNAMLPSLSHLQPPGSCAPIVLERYSRYFAEPAAHGLTHVRPARAYEFIYPFPRESLRRIAYFFDHDQPSEVDRPGCVHRLRHQVSEWRRYGPSARLLADLDGHGGLVITDTRPRAARHRIVLRGLDRLLYEACEEISDLDSLVELVEGRGDGTPMRQDVRRTLAGLVGDGLMAADGERYLSLALPGPLPAVR